MERSCDVSMILSSSICVLWMLLNVNLSVVSSLLLFNSNWILVPFSNGRNILKLSLMYLTSEIYWNLLTYVPEPQNLLSATLDELQEWRITRGRQSLHSLPIQSPLFPIVSSASMRNTRCTIVLSSKVCHMNVNFLL